MKEAGERDISYQWRERERDSCARGAQRQTERGKEKAFCSDSDRDGDT